MTLRAAKDRFLSIPWVYDTLRPLVAGGIDLELLADFCMLGSGDAVFDLGCGTAQLLEFFQCRRYLGVDLDPGALQRASRFSCESVSFLAGDDWDEAYRSLHPTVALMIGVVHHLPDEVFRSIIARLRQAVPLPRRLVTVDVTYLAGNWLNNMLSRMDRGRHVRRAQEYERLFTSCGLNVLRSDILPTRLRYVRYLGYHLAFQ